MPSPNRYPLLSKIIHSVRDYYPLWQARHPLWHSLKIHINCLPAACLPDNRVRVSLFDLSRSLAFAGEAPQPAGVPAGGDTYDSRGRVRRRDIRRRLAGGQLFARLSLDRHRRLLWWACLVRASCQPRYLLTRSDLTFAQRKRLLQTEPRAASGGQWRP